VTVSATDDGPVPGLAVSFFTAGVAGAQATPATVVTGTNGSSMTEVLVPFGASVTLVATGGGTTTSAPISSSPVQLVNPSYAPASFDGSVGPGAAIFAVSVQARSNGVPVPGLTLTYQVEGASLLTVGTATTDTTGRGTAQVSVGADASVPVLISGGGSSTSILVTN
jgi:hypothetical protein